MSLTFNRSGIFWHVFWIETSFVTRSCVDTKALLFQFDIHASSYGYIRACMDVFVYGPLNHVGLVTSQGKSSFLWNGVRVRGAARSEQIRKTS